MNQKKKLYMLVGTKANPIKNLAAKMIFCRGVFAQQVGSLSAESIAIATGLTAKTVRKNIDHLRGLGMWAADGPIYHPEYWKPRKSSASHWSKRVAYWVSLVRRPGDDNKLTTAHTCLYSFLRSIAGMEGQKPLGKPPCPSYLASALNVSRTTIYDGLECLAENRYLKYKNEGGKLRLCLQADDLLTPAQLAAFADKVDMPDGPPAITVGSIDLFDTEELKKMWDSLENLLIEKGCSAETAARFREVNNIGYVNRIYVAAQEAKRISDGSAKDMLDHYLNL